MSFYNGLHKMVDEIPRDVFNRIQLYVHKTETPEALADVKCFGKKPETFYYGELIQVHVPRIMSLLYINRAIGEEEEEEGTDVGGYMMGFSNRVETGRIGNGKVTLNDEESNFVKEQTGMIMRRIYRMTGFPVDHRTSIDDILVVSVLWGAKWHIGLHRGLNRDMREIDMEPLY